MELLVAFIGKLDLLTSLYFGFFETMNEYIL